MLRKASIIAAFLFIGFSVSTQAQTKAVPAAEKLGAPAQTVAPQENLTWDKTVYDFGSIPQGTPATAEFPFTNKTKKPITISNAAGSCGCTVPNWPKEPILPKKGDKISATYNAASPGPFTKTVTVTTSGGGVQVLTIKGTVVTPSTPAAK